MRVEFLLKTDSGLFWLLTTKKKRCLANENCENEQMSQEQKNIYIYVYNNDNNISPPWLPQQTYKYTTSKQHSSNTQLHSCVQGPLREKTKKQSECCSIRPGAFGLPYYCTPPVCVSDVIEVLAVWQHNKNNNRFRGSPWLERYVPW